MKFKTLKPYINTYVIVAFAFITWMLFFDAHSYLFHSELNDEIDDLNYQKQHYINQIENDKKAIKQLSTNDGTERVAREKYFMKKANEDIYIIEYEDSLAKQHSNE